MNEKSNFFTGFLPTSPIICNKEHDPKAKLTRHHRKPKSITRDDSRRNISYVDRLDHDAWHMLYKELAAPDILIQLRIDLEVYGIAPIPSQLVRSLLEKYANNTTEKIKRTHAWNKLFREMNLREILDVINRLDHDAWHMLYKELAAPDILIQLRIDLEVYGIAPIPSQLVRSLLEKYANNTTEKIKRTHAWNKLFREMNLREILDVINRLWLDPDYEAILSVRREQTVELITIPKK